MANRRNPFVSVCVKRSIEAVDDDDDDAQMVGIETKVLLTFHGQEHGVVFLAVAVRRANDVFAFVVGHTAFDFELVVVAVVFLEVFRRLAKFGIITEPGDDRRRDGNDTAIEFGVVALENVSIARTKNEARGGFSSI